MAHTQHGSDGPDGLGPAPTRLRLALAAVLVPLVAATILGLVTMWPEADVQAPPGFSAEVAAGTITDVHGCKDPVPDCKAATVRLSDGVGAPGEVEALLPFGELAPTFEVGERILLGYRAQAPEDERYTFMDFDRTRPLLVLLVLFVVGVIALSRWRGLGSLVGLAGSLLLMAFFTLPALLEGSPAIQVAMVTAAAIMIVTLYLSHGFSTRTSIAMLGTLLALLCTGALGSVFTTVIRFTGLRDEGSQYIATISQGVDLSGLLLAGLVIGALGVLDDVTVSQASAVWELADADATASRTSLFVRGMRIGRAHAASTVNTLVLAYVGATLPLLLVFTALEVEFSAAISQELVAQEVVRGLVGAIGILSAVPITTALAAAVAGTLAAQRRSTATPQPQDADRPGTPQDPGVDRRAPGHRRRR